jgi:hypothetical protein
MNRLPKWAQIAIRAVGGLVAVLILYSVLALPYKWWPFNSASKKKRLEPSAVVLQKKLDSALGLLKDARYAVETLKEENEKIKAEKNDGSHKPPTAAAGSSREDGPQHVPPKPPAPHGRKVPSGYEIEGLKNQ